MPQANEEAPLPPSGLAAISTAYRIDPKRFRMVSPPRAKQSAVAAGTIMTHSTTPLFPMPVPPSGMRELEQQTLASGTGEGEKEGGMGPLLRALQQAGDQKLRRRALVAMVRLGAKAAGLDALRALAEVLLRSSDAMERRLAAQAIGKMGTAAARLGAVPSLIRAMADADASVRATAAWAVGAMGRVAENQGALVTLLHRSVKDTNDVVRQHASQSLERLGKATGKRSAVEAGLAVGGDMRPHPSMRRAMPQGWGVGGVTVGPSVHAIGPQRL
jgi:hypothetical protein